MTSAVPPSTDKVDRLAWLKRHQNRILWGALGVVSAAGIVWWSISSSRRAEAQAERVLNEARLAYSSGNLPLAASDLTHLSEQFPRTRSAQEGAILLAQIRLYRGEHQQAVTFLRDFLDRGPRQEFRASAWSLLGAAYEDLGQPALAGEAYLQASEAAPWDFLKAQYLTDAGRAFWTAGDTTRALDAYRTIVARFEKAPGAGEAKVRIGELTAGGRTARQ